MPASCAGLTFQSGSHPIWAQYEPTRWKYGTHTRCCVMTLRCVTISQLSRLYGTLIILSFHIQQQPWSWLSRSSERQQMWDDETETWLGMGGLNQTGWSKGESAGGKQRASDIKLAKTQSLKPFNTLSAPTPNLKACWCDLSICSQRGGKREGGTRNLGRSVYSFFPLFSHFYTAFLVTLIDPPPVPKPKYTPYSPSCPQLAGVLIA